MNTTLKKAPLIFCVVFFTLFNSCVQKRQNSDADKIRIDNISDSIVHQFAGGNIHKSLKILRGNTVMSQATIDTLELKIADQMQNIFPQFGRMISYEFVAEKKVKDFIAKRFYIIRFSRFFLSVDVTLYNNGNGWKITGFHYNEEAEELLN